MNKNAHYNNASCFLAKLQHIMCPVILTKYYYHDHSWENKLCLEIININYSIMDLQFASPVTTQGRCGFIDMSLSYSLNQRMSNMAKLSFLQGCFLSSLVLPSYATSLFIKEFIIMNYYINHIINENRPYSSSRRSSSLF